MSQGSTNGAAHEAIGRVLGRVPSGVFVLTAADPEGRESAMLASWVQQASFEPPMVSVAVNRERFLNDWFRDNPKMALSLVGEKQHSFLKHFVRGFSPDEPAFEGIETARGITGLPVLSDALGYLEGTIVSRIEAGDHIIYLLELVGAGAGESLADRQPMVHVRRSGFSY